jgi:hypothetical protein
VLAQDQREQARKLFTYLDTQTTAIADTVYRNEVVDYTCRKQLAREREFFFRTVRRPELPVALRRGE